MPPVQNHVRARLLRLRACILVMLVIQAARSAALALDPEGSIRQENWASVLGWSTWVVTVVLFMASIWFWIATVRRAHNAGVLAELVCCCVVLLIISENVGGAFDYRVVATLLKVALLAMSVVGVWYWIRELGAETQREIDARLRRPTAGSQPPNGSDRREQGDYTARRDANVPPGFPHDYGAGFPPDRPANANGPPAPQ